MNALNIFLEREFQHLEEQITAVLEQLKEALSGVEESLKEHIVQELDEQFRKLKEEFNAVQNTLQSLKRDILYQINTRANITDGAIAEIDGALVAIGLLLKGIAAAVSGIEASVVAGFTELNGALILETRRVLVSINSTRRDITKGITKTEDHLTSTVNEKTEEVLEHLKKLKEHVKKELKEQEKTLKEYIFTKFSEIVATDVSLLIVGESYTKWDSVTSYFPTVSFLFNEVTLTNVVRRSQIKIRLPVVSEQVTPEYIYLLQEKCQRLSTLEYNYGTTRANFVSTDKRWKTTIWAASQEEAVRILRVVASVIDETLDEDLFSFTLSRGKRPRITVRQEPLVDVGLNSVSYDEEFVLRLRKVVLYVNNLEKPILLFSQTRF